ncbi:MAG: M23 family metallopeptidase [Rhodospirillaceae bacterium]|nr:M23 family metallopeptidase [Rhodospirillaceae bacterium]
MTITKLGMAALAAATWLAASVLAAPLVEFKGEFVQGGMVVGRTQPGSQVTFDDRVLSVSPDGYFAFGFARDSKLTASLVIVAPDGSRDSQTLKINKRTYDIRRVNGLPQNTVTPDPVELARIADDAKQVAAVRVVDSPLLAFTQGFSWPVLGPISGVYGSQSILNGEARSPHLAVDIAAPEGAEITAPADGVVTFAHQDLLLTGRTMILDHGHGIATTYSHMSAMSAKVGDRVKKGDPIGKVGKTGRVTGPHLHWGLSWLSTALDAQLVVPPMPK